MANGDADIAKGRRQTLGWRGKFGGRDRDRTSIRRSQRRNRDFSYRDFSYWLIELGIFGQMRNGNLKILDLSTDLLICIKVYQYFLINYCIII